MRRIGIVAAAVMAAGCGSGSAPIAPHGEHNEPSQSRITAPGWSLESGSAGTSLIGGGIRLTCVAGQNRLLVTVPSFRPVASEDRLSVGGDGEALTLVADRAGDARLDGVTGAGPIPDELKRFITAPISASYGSQRTGPHQPPPEGLAGRFLAACANALTEARAAKSKPPPSTSPCLVQDGRLLSARPIRAIGTEPFWGARVEGRCVTYSHPDDQKGTRVWTRINDGPDGSVFVGALNGKPFILRMRGSMQCSDGMSDNQYRIAVWLTVNGEERRGCAELL